MPQYDFNDLKFTVNDNSHPVKWATLLDTMQAALNGVDDDLALTILTVQTDRLLAQDASAAARVERLLAEAAESGAQTALANAVAVVSGGTASLTALSGKIPIANAQGKIDDAWLSYNIPALQSVLTGLNVVALTYYDTANDSDGGGWIKRTCSLSYAKESVPSGKYLGALATTALAEAVSGAVIGDYYFHTTLFQFRELTNLAGGSVEIFRAGSPTFPSQVLIVAETDRVIIFDASGSELNMWMIIKANANTILHLDGAGYITSMAMIEGELWVTSSAASGIKGLYKIAFATDTAHFYRGNVDIYGGDYPDIIANRNITNYNIRSYIIIVSDKCNDIAVTVLDNAPIDNETGLRIPTVRVFTDAGISVIENDGTVTDIVDSSAYNNTGRAHINQDGSLLFGNRDSSVVGPVRHVQLIQNMPDADYIVLMRNEYPYLPASVDGYQVGSKFAGTYLGNDSVGVQAISENSVGTQLGLTVFKINPDDPAKSMVAHIDHESNTGYMVGDTRLAALCDTETGAIVETQLFADSTLDSESAWGKQVSGTSSIVFSAGSVNITSDASGSSANITQPNLTIGNHYLIIVKSMVINSGVGVKLFNGSNSKSLTANGTHSFFFVATTPAAGISRLGASDNVDFTDLELFETIPDRSGNDNHLQLHGTLNRDVIGDGEIALYSGSSSTDYLSMSAYTPTSDLLYCGLVEFSLSGTEILCSTRSNRDDIMMAGDNGWTLFAVAGNLYLRNDDGATITTLAAGAVPAGTFHLVVYENAGTVSFFTSGRLLLSGSITLTAGQPLSLCFFLSTYKHGVIRSGNIIPSNDQIAKMSRDELAMLQGGAVLDGNDPDIKAITYDKSLNAIHAASEGTISTFRGLERIESNLDSAINIWDEGEVPILAALTTRVSTVAIETGKPYYLEGMPENIRCNTGVGWSALNGLFIPAGYSVVQFRNVHATDATIAFTPSLKEITKSAPITSLESKDGALIIGGTNGFDVDIPEVPIRERMARALSNLSLAEKAANEAELNAANRSQTIAMFYDV